MIETSNVTYFKIFFTSQIRTLKHMENIYTHTVSCRSGEIWMKFLRYAVLQKKATDVYHKKF